MLPNREEWSRKMECKLLYMVPSYTHMCLYGELYVLQLHFTRTRVQSVIPRHSKTVGATVLKCNFFNSFPLC